VVDVVRVEGLKEVQRALRRLGEIENSKELRLGLKAAAAVVAQDAKGQVPIKSGRAAQSIRAGATGQKAYVAGGKRAVPYYGWLDFGTRTPRSGRPRSVGPWAGTGAGPKLGRFIYVALEEKRPRVVELVQEAVLKLEREAGLK
jgi:hypothetical protein